MAKLALDDALAGVRDRLLDVDSLVRAVGSGRRKGHDLAWRRAEVRWVDLRAGRRLQVTTYDATQAHTANHAPGAAAERAVAALLAEPFGNWYVESATEVLQLRVTKKGDALVGTSAAVSRLASSHLNRRQHDRPKERLLPADDPLLARLGIADDQGRIKPSRQAKYRQVEEFLRILDTSITDALGRGLRRPTAEDPLRIVDLGCGNGYLTFAAHRFLSVQRDLPVRLIGVDVKQQSRDHNAAVAAELGIDAEFVVGSIAEAELPPPAVEVRGAPAGTPAVEVRGAPAVEVRAPASLETPAPETPAPETPAPETPAPETPAPAPDVVLALHACDTATDEALARAVAWEAPLVLAAPCCHHDLAEQLRRSTPPPAYAELTRHGILRERLADTLTDAARSLLLRARGYRIEVMEFVDSQHTPRNTLVRAVWTGTRDDEAQREYDELVTAWGVTPRLAQLLGA